MFLQVSEMELLVMLPLMVSVEEEEHDGDHLQCSERCHYFELPVQWADVFLLEEDHKETGQVYLEAKVDEPLWGEKLLVR